MNNISPVGLDVANHQEMVHSKHITEEAKIQEATRQFEGVMVRQVLKEWLVPLFESELVQNSAANDIYRSYLIDVMADSMTRSGGVGITTSLQAAVTQHAKSNPDSSQ